MSQNRVMIRSESGQDRGGRMKDTVQEVRHLSAQYPRTTRALPAHYPRTGHDTASPYGFVGAATHDSFIIIATASSVVIIIDDDNNARHRGFA